LNSGKFKKPEISTCPLWKYIFSHHFVQILNEVLEVGLSERGIHLQGLVLATKIPWKFLWILVRFLDC
jgi:hypothetical protein